MAPNAQIRSWLDEFDAESARGRGTEGVEQLIARITGANGDPATWQRAAEHLFRAGQFAATAVLLDVALRHHGDRSGLRYWRGNALRMLGQTDQAERDFRAALDHDPANRDAAFSLAFMLREHGRIDSASTVVVSLWQARPNEREIVLAALEFLRECGAQTHAREIAQHVSSAWPDDARLNALAGEVLLALGEFDAARVMLRRALDRDHGQASACLRLAQCQRFTRADDADLQRFRSVLADSTREHLPKICAGFALGKALDDLGEFAEAATVLRAANANAAEDVPWHAQDWQRFVDARIAAAGSLPRTKVGPGFIPIFIVGLPRSGTTLVATRLGRHADVHDRGELNWIPAMHEHLQAQDRLSDPQALAAVAQMVGAQMRRDDAPTRYVIDKNPLNFRYLNFVQALFPNARIIHCQRGERDIALSLWQQHFAHPDLAFSYRFDAIALFIQGYQRLMRHWRNALALPCIDLHYEALVADEAAESRHLAEFLGLPVESAPVSHAASSITTASVWQARQPVYQHSVGRWKNYAAYLPELERLFSA